MKKERWDLEARVASRISASFPAARRREEIFCAGMSGRRKVLLPTPLAKNASLKVDQLVGSPGRRILGSGCKRGKRKSGGKKMMQHSRSGGFCTKLTFHAPLLPSLQCALL